MADRDGRPCFGGVILKHSSSLSYISHDPDIDARYNHYYY